MKTGTYYSNINYIFLQHATEDTERQNKNEEHKVYKHNWKNEKINNFRSEYQSTRWQMQNWFDYKFNLSQ